MKEFIKPNWKQSILNISATLAEFLGAPNNNEILPELTQELGKGYKNVVFICLDGMGINPININLDENSLLRKNIKQKLTSTFPSTTTSATTSLICNKQPLEHGWFGWSLHFDEIGRNLDIYLHSDSKTGEKVNYNYPIADNSDCYFDNANTDYNISLISPGYVQTKSKDKKIVIENEVDLCKEIGKVCAKEGKQFVYAYLPEPDYTMHEFGVSSPEAKAKIENINAEIEKLFDSLKDTLIIITADHGQIDVAGYVEFYKDKEINSLLSCVPYLDARTPAFVVKPGKEKEFAKLFEERYGNDFTLFKTSELINQGYFGSRGEYGYLLGDYRAIGTYTHKQFLAYDNQTRFKGHHTSLTEEMEVPLIVLKK